MALYNINVFSFSVSNGIFSPNADHTIDTITIFAYLNAPYIWTINVRDSNNGIKRVFTGTGSTINQVWDGKDSLGTVCPDGIYIYTIDVTDPLSGAVAPQVSGTVMIDNTPPQANIIEPLSGAILSGTVNIKCFADDLNISSVCFYYGNGTSPTDWVRVAVANRIGSSSEFLADWNTAACINGECILRLVVYDNAGNNKIVDLPVSLYNVNILGFSVSQYIFSPNADGRYDAVTITSYFTAAYNWIINIEDFNNNIKRAFSGYSSSVNQVWDGKDSSYATVPDGSYTCTINATDPVSGIVAPQASQAVIVDSTLPEASITEPIPNASLSGVVNIKGIADDLHFSYAYLYYGKGVLPTTWNLIGGVAVHNPGLLAIWDTTTHPNGNYVLRLEVYDYAGNKKIMGVPVQIFNEGPDIDNLTARPNPFSPDESGTWIDLTTGEVFNDPGPNRILDDVAAISFTATSSGFFDIKIFDSGDVLVKQLVYSALSPDPITHKIELQWNGRDDSGAVLKNGQYRLVVNGGSVEKEKSIMIGIDKKPFITGVAAIPNPFSPNNDGINEMTTISYNISENSYVTAEVYNPQNNVVCTLINNQLFASGSHSCIWGGKNDLGGDLPEGRYTIKISAKAEAGNVGDPVYINVSMLFISDIHISTDSINPYSGESTSIIYQMGADSILSIRIYDSTGTLVRNLISNQSRPVGNYSEVWDGMDDLGQIVHDGSYYFIIEDSISGTPIVAYDPRGTGGKDISKSIGFSASDFNPLLNQFSILNYNMPQAAKINIKVRSYRFSGPVVKVIKYQEPVSRGAHQTLWDGRDEIGSFVDMTMYIFAIWGYTLDENSIVVTGGKPVISSPSLDLARFNPYDNPYNLDISQSAISFNLSKDANVTINIYGSSGNLLRALLANQPCMQGANLFIWDGKDNAGNLAIDDYYRVMIQAEKGGNYSEAHTLHSEISY